MLDIRINQEILKIDLLEELLPYFENDRMTKITQDKLVAKSPFRNDNHPSFFVNLTHYNGTDGGGTWVDSGADDLDEYKSGNFLKLLNCLRAESWSETVDYLFAKYQIKPYETLTLPSLHISSEKWVPLGFSGDEFANGYLLSRGIRSGVAQKSGVMDLGDKIVFHWYDLKDNIIAIKYRLKDRKEFYYSKGGRPLKNYLYNLNLYKDYTYPNPTVWITEGEVDALSVQAYSDTDLGVAMGSATFTDKQAESLLSTGVTKVVIATDNDKQGVAAKSVVTKKLSGYVDLYEIDLGECKDVNDYVRMYKHLPKMKPIIETTFKL